MPRFVPADPLWPTNAGAAAPIIEPTPAPVPLPRFVPRNRVVAGATLNAAAPRVVKRSDCAPFGMRVIAVAPAEGARLMPMVSVVGAEALPMIVRLPPNQSPR